MGRVIRGDLFRIEDKSQGWLCIDLDDRQTVWIDAAFTSPTSLPPTTERQPGREAMANPAVEDLKIRSGPGVYYPAIATASSRDNYRILQVTRNWIQIAVNKITRGWVHQALIR